MKSKIGLITGKGTGEELVDIFKRVISLLAKINDKEIEFIETDYKFSTYWSVKNDNNFFSCSTEQEKEAELLLKTFSDFKNFGVDVVFRTAINAESLYILRQKALAVKEINIDIGNNRNLLLIRDETQGFYANHSYQLMEKIDSLKFEGGFSRENFKKILKYSFDKAFEILGESYEAIYIYKYHLFCGGIIEKWINSLSNKGNIYQPDSGIDLLLNKINSNDQNSYLLITSNEVGDIIFEFLAHYLKLGSKNELYSKNIYLSDLFRGLTVFQTVHGSADFIKGKDIVNPIATLRIAGRIAEDYLGVEKGVELVGNAIKNAEQQLLISPDKGGDSKTSEIVSSVLSYINHLSDAS